MLLPLMPPPSASPLLMRDPLRAPLLLMAWLVGCRVKAAKFIGIVVGTLGAQNYLGMIRRLQARVSTGPRGVTNTVRM